MPRRIRAITRTASSANVLQGGSKLWVDTQDFGWIKVDGEVTQPFSMGLFVARVQRGSHIILEQTCVGDAVWVPKRLEVRASARILFLKSLNVDRILITSTIARRRTARTL